MITAADVKGKRILITGGASGIGAASGLLLARRGASVILSDLAIDQGEKLASQGKQEGLDITFKQVDVSAGSQVRSLFSFAMETLGGIDVVLNNAGVDHEPRPLHELTDEDFDRNIAINLKGVWHCMRAAIACMASNGGGHVINLASIAGLRSAPSLSAYSASKHGVVGLTKTAALEYAKINIRFNAVCPSFIDTPMVQNNLDKLDERGKNLIVKASPLKRLGHVDEIANAIAWLASDESSFMNGHCLTLDGGMLA
ncbi:SDR family NAD(P)-dependent oxidoreductase [Glaciecola petra]|uniref:SDR family NAD(P)-dependent oxidoreductase n=1 Tax=Glaciecola petra TaxID=3075602 RepID=A0ABU2ZP12_9ALTE|nr:SDR family NAD(P)-dependent oxidoreductase [Aestuariibacter sp. P117]MDT0594362.1 SDR family NAD(P)-dependent oxidoreductase [Aestuariibacter sp. P117]